MTIAAKLLNIFRISDTEKGNTKPTFILLSLIMALSTAITGLLLFCCTSSVKPSRKQTKNQTDYHGRIVLSAGVVASILTAVLLTQLISSEWLNIDIAAFLLVLAICSSLLLISDVSKVGDSYSFKRMVWTVLTWLFILSIPWEWLRLYKHNIAEQYTHTMKVRV